MKAQKIITILATFGVFAFVSSVFVTKANAEEICFTEYGGGETCYETDDDSNLDVNKKIWNPESGDYQDHVNPTDGSYPYIFDPSETIKFQIQVRNTGEVRIENIELKDILPSYVKYKDGDGDGNDDNTKVEFDEFDLDAGESETFEFTAEVAPEGILPKDSRICLTNVAEAEGEVEDSDDTESDVDYANFCVDLPQVKGAISTLPVTGGLDQNAIQLILISSIAGGLVLIGFGFKKLAKTF